MMAASDTKAIVIVGAGPVGLATALSLAEGGANPLLLDATADRLRAPPDLPGPIRREFDERVARTGAAIAFRQVSVFHAEPGRSGYTPKARPSAFPSASWFWRRDRCRPWRRQRLAIG